MKSNVRISSLFQLLLSVLALVSLVPDCGALVELTVTNGSFESPRVTEGTFYQGVPQGWSGEGEMAIMNPNDAFFPGTTDTLPGPKPIDGSNAVWINYGGSLSYYYPERFAQPNVVYALTVLAGQRSDAPFGNGSVSLWAGTNLLVEAIPNPPNGTFIKYSLTYTSPPAATVIGKPLGIRFAAPTPNSQVWFDDVHLFADELFCNPHKATATAQLFNGIFVGATIIDSGCGYTNAPAVTIQGGGGQGATAVALLVDGRVSEIRVSNGGCCYTSVPTVVIESPPRMSTVEIRFSKVKVKQNVTLGRRYLLESSFDSVVWTATGPVFTATSETIENEYDVDVTGRFFRLREVP